jgi:hypothetical protein
MMVFVVVIMPPVAKRAPTVGAVNGAHSIDLDIAFKGTKPTQAL